MGRPEGITKKTKDNSRKRPYEREQWEKGKRIGRPKQVWVIEQDHVAVRGGHWEKVK